METIQELIQRLCPNGVAYQTLGEVCEIKRGKRLTKKELSENGKYPVFHGGVLPLGYYDNFNRHANQTMVINTGSVGEVAWSGVDFWSSDGTFVIETPDSINDRFLYHYLKANEPYFKGRKREGGVPTISREDVSSLLIPIPPREVQEKIVEILDRLAALASDLVRGLPAEMTARQKQYEYYRNQLLTFPNPLCDERLCPNGVAYQTLGEVLGYEQPSKYIVSSTAYEDEGTPVLTAGQTFILGYTAEKEGIYQASPENPVIIFDDFTTSFHWVTFDFKVKSSAMKMLKPTTKDVSFRYIYYAMKCIKYIPGEHARQWISVYSSLLIPIPPREVQEKIVEILDRLAALQAALQAEQEKRQKQYEYYRNQLLTFKNIDE